MDSLEFERLTIDAANAAFIKVEELQNKHPRTLLRGKSNGGEEWHFYLDGKRRFWLVVYSSDCIDSKNATRVEMFAGYVRINHIFRLMDSENKHVFDELDELYPDLCDYEFTRLLITHGVHLKFTDYKEQRTGFGAFLGITVTGDWYDDVAK